VDRVDAVVVGAGVVGLAIGRALALRGLETVVLERESGIGTGISSRNSEVIHAGLYNPTDWFKTRLCVRGRELLYAYCESRGVPHRRCGKLVVATSQAQRAELQRIEARARSNGVSDLLALSAAEARALEPALHCVAALHSPATGIVDSHALMLALQGDLEGAGGWLAVQSPLVAAARRHDGWVLQVGGAVPMALASRVLVNAAGLWAIDVAGRIDGLDRSALPQAHFAKGNYFSLAARSPFTRLIYPVPEPGGLGVHLTLDLAGQARFGPDVEWIAPASPAQIDFRVDVARGAAFDAEIRRYWPGLPEAALQPAYSGVRPKLSGPGEPAQDFMLQGPAEHGLAGLMNLFGIESPGLTASLALADEVLSRLGL
jgi:L-2-hydroxyglutarate oxidase LhgO